MFIVVVVAGVDVVAGMPEPQQNCVSVPGNHPPWYSVQCTVLPRPLLYSTVHTKHCTVIILYFI